MVALLVGEAGCGVGRGARCSDGFRALVGAVGADATGALESATLATLEADVDGPGSVATEGGVDAAVGGSRRIAHTIAPLLPATSTAMTAAIA